MGGSKTAAAVGLFAAVLVIMVLPAPTLGFAGGACRKDAAKLCPGMKPGDRGYAECMKKHEADLSDACKQMMQARAKDAEQFKACAADAEKFCPGTQAGGGRVMKCLRTHQGDLSEECKRELAARHGGR